MWWNVPPHSPPTLSPTRVWARSSISRAARFGEGQEQDAPGIHALLHEVSHAVDECAGLARARGSQHKERPIRGRYRRQLLGVQ